MIAAEKFLVGILRPSGRRQYGYLFSDKNYDKSFKYKMQKN